MFFSFFGGWLFGLLVKSLLSLAFLVVKSLIISAIVVGLAIYLREKFFKKAIVVAKEDMEYLVDVMTKKGHRKQADRLTKMLNAKEKRVLIDKDDSDKNYEIKGLSAESSSRDSMKYGGVVFKSGEYIKYDEDGNEQRKVAKINAKYRLKEIE